MFGVLFFVLLFFIIVAGILYNVHVKAMTTGVTEAVDLVTDVAARAMYDSPPIFNNNLFTNDFYTDLPLAAPEVNVKENVDVPKTQTHYYRDNKKNALESQVYHIFNNIYNFEQAEQECVSRKGRLATKKELTQAYNDKGAAWCSWGWASNGHAYLPNRDRKCNASSAGLLDAPKVDKMSKLGVNCFGVPPQPQPPQQPQQPQPQPQKLQK